MVGRPGEVSAELWGRRGGESVRGTLAGGLCGERGFWNRKGGRIG